jgi:hypothetical protein
MLYLSRSANCYKSHCAFIAGEITFRFDLFKLISSPVYESKHSGSIFVMRAMLDAYRFRPSFSSRDHVSRVFASLIAAHSPHVAYFAEREKIRRTLKAINPPGDAEQL